MRRVFVYENGKIDNPYTVIFKDTKEQEDIDDVLIFNGYYRRMNGRVGWHGVVSDEINTYVIRYLNSVMSPLIFMPKLYYPRMVNYLEPIKKIPIVHFKLCGIYVKGQPNHNMSEVELLKRCQPFDGSINDYDE